MNDLMPPERGVSPALRARLREEVMENLETQRSRSRWVVPLAAAAALLAVVGLTVGVLRGGDDPAPVADPPAGAVPGFTPEQLADIQSGCLAAVRRHGAVIDGLRLYNAASDGFLNGSALLIAPGGEALCTWDHPYDPANPRAAGAEVRWRPTRWLWAPLTAEHILSGDRWERISGRVQRGAARVQMTVDGVSVTVPVVNGTYIATVRIPRKPGLPTAVLRSFDAHGTLLYETTDPLPDAPCAIAPDGTPIIGTPKPGSPCPTAVPW